MKKQNSYVTSKVATLALLPFALMIQAQGVQAQTPNQSSQLSLGVAEVWTKSPVIGEDDEQKLRPYIDVKYGIFRLNSKGLGLGTRISAASEVNAFITYRESPIDHDDNSELTSLSERDTAIEFALNWTHSLPIVDISGTATWDISDTYNGYETQLRFSKKIPTPFGILIPATGFTYQSEELVDYYYGVSTTEANGTITAYQGKSSVNTNISLTHILPITNHLHTMLTVNYGYLGAGIKDSSIVEHSSAWTGVAAIFYKF